MRVSVPCHQEFQRLAAGVLWQGRVYEDGEVGLKNAGAAPSCPEYRGRNTRRRKPSRRSTSLMLRSAITTPKCALIARTRSALRQRVTPSRASSGPSTIQPDTAYTCSVDSRQGVPARL